MYTYPDAAVYCGTIIARAGTTDVATNPSLLVEVLSDSTREYDLGEKLKMYKRIPSLKHIVFVEPDEAHVIVWTQTAGVWHEQTISTLGETLRLAGIDVEVPLSELYAGVVGPEGPLPV